MHRFVLTGGHGVGKTSLLHALEEAGETVVQEAAAAIRALGRARGNPFPEDALDFESRALALHLHREVAVPTTTTRLFLDRGAPDYLAYTQIGHWTLTDTEIATASAATYDLALIVELPDPPPATLDRGETAFCRRLVATLHRQYDELGIPVVRVPYGPVDDRIRFIVDTIAELQADTDRTDTHSAE